MNFTIYLSDIYIEQYPLITNARLNVDITYCVNIQRFNGPAHLCDSDVDFYGEQELEFEPMWGETQKESGTWKPLTPDQIQEICEEYEDEIVKMLWEFIEEINEEMKYE